MMNRLLLPLLAALSATLFLVAPPAVQTAHADFVQTMTCSPSGANRCSAGEEPLPVRWFQQEVAYLIHDQGSQDLHPGESEVTDEVKSAVFRSFDAWNGPDCSDFYMVYGGKSADAPIGNEQGTIPIHDLINVLVWRDDAWPYHGSFNAVALTTVTYRPSSGEILAADIEFNTAQFNYTNTEDGQGAHIDFRNTLTHEVGHFLGLDHSPNPEATMFATAPQGEISKRTLHQADIDGLCHIYPEGGSYNPGDHTNGNGDDDGSGRNRCGCATTDMGKNSAIPTLFFILMGLIALRRSSR